MEPESRTPAFTGLFVFHESWNQAEPVEPEEHQLALPATDVSIVSKSNEWFVRCNYFT